jgi:glycerophosphoryl diester phosphodiesterase
MIAGANPPATVANAADPISLRREIIVSPLPRNMSGHMASCAGTTIERESTAGKDQRNAIIARTDVHRDPGGSRDLIHEDVQHLPAGDRPLIIYGHRGARFEAPENTIPGFRFALSLGLRGIEFDVRLSADDRLVVIHDATVDRTTNGTGNVGELTFDEIRALDARSTFPDWPEPCIVPTLAEVLDVVGHLETLEVEIKKDTPERLERVVPMVLAELASRELPGQVIVTSFEVHPLELAQRRAPDRERGYVGAWDSPEFLETALRLGATRACIPFRTGSAEIVKAAQDAGLSVNGWPCNTREELDEHLRRGVDTICSDAPSTIRTWLES